MRNLKTALAALILLCAVLSTYTLHAQSNPVQEGVADAGVINFNGKYYLAGVATLGGYYVSDDLVKWTGPIHIFSMNNDWTRGKPFGDNQIHAADIKYWNGKFHFYWSVNFWGAKNMTVHIGHAVADNILGPYTEPNKKTWFDSRIDADMFINNDSTFYFYSVKFTDGNTIWGQPMADPWTLKGDPKYIFNSLPETWERYDNNVAEGPWVMKYRSRYYMMYNTNHSSNQWGNYALGVSEANGPLDFNSGNKYLHPVVQQNLTDNPEEMRYYFTSSTEAFTNWKYTFDKPADDWLNPGFADGGWRSGEKGFAKEAVAGSTLIRRQTVWTTDDIWIRKQFTMKPGPSTYLQLLVNHSGPTEVYIDGQLVYSGNITNYATIDLKSDIIQKLKAGNNVIAVHSKAGRRGANVDVDLIDPLTKPGDDILLNPGQPNIVKGPNGMEWWLVYFGIKNNGRRGQFIDRVLFNDHQLTVDGMTGPKTQGYHPNPSQPVFADGFETADNINTKWDIKGGNWQVQKGELNQKATVGKTTAFIRSYKAGNYLFKVGVKNDFGKKGSAGIVAYYASATNYLEIGINATEGNWYSKLMRNGVVSVKKNKLSAVFNYDVYHSLSVYKNAGRFDVLIDDNPAPGNNKIASSFATQGIPGLFTEGSSATFDAAIYTPGFDEYNATITGWGNANSSEKAAGKWITTNNGIIQSAESGSFAAFKGDLLNQYEFSTQLYLGLNAKADKGNAGIYPVYIDKDNYLQTALNFETGQLTVEGKLRGKAIENSAIPLKRTLAQYPDPKYGDGLNKFYPLKKNTELSAMEIVKTPYSHGDFRINLFDSLKVYYRNNGEWYPLDYKVVARDNQALNKIEFGKITADAIRLVSATADNSVHVYKLYVAEEKTSDYNLRAVKLGDKVILFLDGKQVADIKGAWPASQVGLVGKDAPVSYNGITLFEK